MRTPGSHRQATRSNFLMACACMPAVHRNTPPYSPSSSGSKCRVGQPTPGALSKDARESDIFFPSVALRSPRASGTPIAAWLQMNFSFISRINQKRYNCVDEWLDPCLKTNSRISWRKYMHIEGARHNGAWFSLGLYTLVWCG